MEARLDSRASPIIVKTVYNATKDWDTIKFLTEKINTPIEGRHDIYFIMVKPNAPNDKIINVKSITFIEN